MATDGLVDELEVLLGSSREARWVADELADLPDADRGPRARDLAARRRAGEPLQYVLGHWPFRGLDLVVDARALIPRPETEQLVGHALGRLAGLDGSDTVVACDLGCGTGAIALSLATEGRDVVARLDVHATDVSTEALALARLNARRVGASVAFHEGSWYEAIPPVLTGRIHLVCANPPYVSARERELLARELDFEPQLALVADDGTDGTDGFGAVEVVIDGAGTWLAPGGWLVVEHAEGHRDAAVRRARRSGLTEVEDLDDLAGRPRFLVARARR